MRAWRLLHSHRRQLLLLSGTRVAKGLPMLRSVLWSLITSVSRLRAPTRCRSSLPLAEGLWLVLRLVRARQTRQMPGVLRQRAMQVGAVLQQH